VRAVAFIIALLISAPAAAREIAIGLTDDLIEVDAGFFGANFVLFGAVVGGEPEAAPDIVAVVRGPDTTFRMRPMMREGSIWRAGPALDVAGEAGLLIALSSRPLAEIAPDAALRAVGAVADPERIAARLAPRSDAAAAHAAARGGPSIGAAFIEDGKRAGRILEEAGAVVLRKAGLFSIEVALPPRTPVGEYSIAVYLFKDGEVVARDGAALLVDKVGIERRIFDLAHKRPVSYGVACVAIAAVAGWLAAAAFRK
jgi:uncharacterized protein (TIGR02186 family)